MMPARGSTPAVWGHWDMVLGLGEHLLPVVCDPGPVPSSGSKIKKWGKVPSAYNGAGEAHGIKDWQSRPLLLNEFQIWRNDARLGLCVRTGISGAYAIDVDVTDPTLAAQIMLDVAGLGPDTYYRTRPNTSKFLVPFEMVERDLSKRVIKTKHGPIEMLGAGQQFLVDGTHESGVRYEWPNGMPPELPKVALEQLDALWVILSRYGEPVQEKEHDQLEPGEQLTTIADDELEQLRSALYYPKLRAACADNDSWSEVGYALLSLGARGRELFCTWSKDVPGYIANAPEDWWSAHADQEPRSDYRHVFTLARRLGWGATASTDSFGAVAQHVADSGGVLRDPLDIEQAPLPRPVIRLVEGNLPDIARAATDVIAPEIFKQSRYLVRIGRPDELDDGIKRLGDHRPILPLTTSYLRVLLGDRADIVRYDGRSKEWKRADCPMDLARTLIEMGDWPRVRPLEAIARAPFVRLDGTVCGTPGYDRASRVFYLPNAEFPALPELITMEIARDALDSIITPFREFPHAAPASLSAFVAHILTESARAAIRTSPMFWYTAPDAGTGKTLLSEMPSAIVHGVQPAVRPWVAESEELRKTLFASLVAGDRSIMFDNVPSGYKARSAELCAFLTSPVWKDRKLGASEVFEVPNRSVISASGNNITPVADMARRSLVIRLDANSASRKSRRFTITDLRAYVGSHRVDLLTAALTIIVGYQQNKGGKMPVPLPSFEDWSYMVREPLIWLGMEDPVNTQDEETDDESGSIDGAFATLGMHFAGREFTAVAICDLANGFSNTDGAIAQSLITAGCSDPTSPIKIGYWLRNCRDKIGGGYKLVRGGRNRAANRWMLKPIDQSEGLV